MGLEQFVFDIHTCPANAFLGQAYQAELPDGTSHIVTAEHVAVENRTRTFRLTSLAGTHLEIPAGSFRTLMRENGSAADAAHMPLGGKQGGLKIATRFNPRNEFYMPTALELRPRQGPYLHFMVHTFTKPGMKRDAPQVETDDFSVYFSYRYPDEHILPGNSGAPLIAHDGRVFAHFTHENIGPHTRQLGDGKGQLLKPLLALSHK